MGACLAKTSRSEPIDLIVIDPSSNIEREPLRKVLTMCRPPEPLTTTTGLTISQDGEESRGILMLSNLSMWLGGALTTSKERQFEEKKVTKTGDQIPADFLKELGVAATCRKGLKPESPNQDDYCVAVHDSALILGVFDGHGPAGHEVSAFVSLALPQAMISHESLRQNPANAVLIGFQQAQNELIASFVEGKRSFDSFYSGTTATLAVVTRNRLTLGHLGDSRAVLCQLDSVTHAPTAIPLTLDHKPHIPCERERIEASGGEVRTLEGDSTYRVFFAGKDFPGLSITRAIGDVTTHPLGITSIPDIIQREIEDNDEFLLICSDGVWEFISNEEAVQLVWSFGQEKAREAAEELAKLAWKSWIKNEEGIVDDITILIAYFRANVD
jgi:serine/threonine protein phosphatase PrpC